MTQVEAFCLWYLVVFIVVLGVIAILELSDHKGSLESPQNQEGFPEKKPGNPI